MKCPICETEGCRRVERETADKLIKFECVKCEEFYVEKNLAKTLETDFEQILRTNLGEDIILNKEKIDTYRTALSEHIDTHKHVQLIFDTNNIRENQISIKKLLQIVHLIVSANDNNCIFETLYRNENGQYALFYDSENKVAWAEYLPDLPPERSGAGRSIAVLEGIHSREEAFRKLKRWLINNMTLVVQDP